MYFDSETQAQYNTPLKITWQGEAPETLQTEKGALLVSRREPGVRDAWQKFVLRTPGQMFVFAADGVGRVAATCQEGHHASVGKQWHMTPMPAAAAAAAAGGNGWRARKQGCWNLAEGAPSGVSGRQTKRPAAHDSNQTPLAAAAVDVQAWILTQAAAAVVVAASAAEPAAVGGRRSLSSAIHRR